MSVAGVAGSSADARSVVLNVTAADPVGSGYVTVFPAGSSAPNASNLNLRRGVTRPNLVVVEVGASGAVDLLAAGTSTHLLVDVLGYFGDGGMTSAVDPVRVFDTRTGSGTTEGAMGHGETRTIRIAGVEGVPEGATGVHVNITVVSPTAAGYLSVWPTGAAQPTVSNLNWRAGEVVPNMAIVGLGPDGTLQVFLSTGNDSTGQRSRARRRAGVDRMTTPRSGSPGHHMRTPRPRPGCGGHDGTRTRDLHRVMVAL